MILLMTYVVACYTIKVFVGSIQIIMNTIRGNKEESIIDEEPIVITKEDWEEIKREMKEVKKSVKEVKNKMKIDDIEETQ